MGQEEIVPQRPIYPPTSNDLFGNGDDIIPIRNGGFIDNNDDGNTDQLKLHLSPYLRHWLIAYRKAQENSNGYPFNNMI
ncbi:neuropeptide CCHamide-2-like [Arctopsyche grandis]|uniref:neuropeptide CCHamide-2-like n=1 Tax=Arctopsyche grandis TaxID=121162 RepID=UPI00406D88F6